MVGFAAAVPGAILLQLGGSEWVLGLAAIVVRASASPSRWRVPKVQVAAEPEPPRDEAELRGAGVLLARLGHGLLRGIVGFLTFLLAFSLRDRRLAHLALRRGAGRSRGRRRSPARRWPRRCAARPREERILAGSSLVVGGARRRRRPGSAGCPAAALVAAGRRRRRPARAKQAFDSIVQRDAPDANRGRSFARFETRFQLVWVVGAVLGIIPMPMWLGFVLVAAIAAFAGASYAAGSRGCTTSSSDASASAAGAAAPTPPPCRRRCRRRSPRPTRTRPPSDDPTTVEGP